MRAWPLLLIILTACSTTPPAPVEKVAPPPKVKVVKKHKAKVVQPAREVPAANDELIQRLKSSDAVVIDVRSAEEYVNGHVVGAKNIDFLRTDFEKQISKLSNRKRYYLYCASGNRSGKALRYLLARGIQAESIEPYESLKAQGVPLEGLSP